MKINVNRLKFSNKIQNKQKLLYAELTDNNDVPTSELSGIDRLTQADVLKVIQELPSGYRLIVNLYLVEGYTHKEIGDMLSISEGTSKSQLSRAKQILQTMVQQYIEKRKQKQ